jgi:hypothetical protein
MKHPHEDCPKLSTTVEYLRDYVERPREVIGSVWREATELRTSAAVQSASDTSAQGGPGTDAAVASAGVDTLACNGKARPQRLSRRAVFLLSWSEPYREIPQQESSN